MKEYINDNREMIYGVDTNNLIILVDGTPLGKLFDVKVFHIAQLRDYLLQHMISLPPSNTAGATSPARPIQLIRPTSLLSALQAIGSSASNTDTISNTERAPPLAQPEAQGQTSSPPGGSSQASSASTEPVHTSGDEISDVFYPEYDVEDSESDIGRPNGGYEHKSTNSESNLDLSFEYVNRDEVNRQFRQSESQTVYWADSEGRRTACEEMDEDNNQDNAKNGELRSKTINCINFLKCGQKKVDAKYTGFWYCPICWKKRVNWISARKRKKNKKKRPMPGEDGEEDPEQLCKICFDDKGDSAFVHNQIAHRHSCYKCAKKWWKNKSECPICRRTIEKIIKVI